MGGLRRLEYRGYDSAGISVISEGQLATRKKAGKLDNLVADIKAHPIAESRIGIGHTRWATHGAPTDQNAHPHLGGPSSKLALIHNGIIENFSELKQELLDAGTSFASETDSEVAAHLIAKEYEASKDLVSAFGKVVNRLHGAFTILVIHEDFPDLILAARKNAPLVIGLGEGENFLGSDVAAFVEHTKRAISVGQDEIVILRPSGVEIQGFDGHKVDSKEFTIDFLRSESKILIKNVQSDLTANFRIYNGQSGDLIYETTMSLTSNTNYFIWSEGLKFLNTEGFKKFRFEVIIDNNIIHNEFIHI